MNKEQKATLAGVSSATSVTGGSISAVYALGVPGLGATGITSGLAAVGSVLGGGMATGLVLTVAAPLAIGVAAYGLYSWLTD
jgi:hypothetical protein